MLNKDTKVCISIAARPGKFGVEFHNKGYNFLGLNYVYLPLKVEEHQLDGITSLIRGNFHGCSVSMPHKVKVIKYLDELDGPANNIQAVNTVLNVNGRLMGYNTDYFGAKKAISSKLDISGRDVYMLGAGGVARAIGQAVRDLGGNLIISNRNEEKGKNLSDYLGCSFITPDKISPLPNSCLFINATSLGMADERIPLNDEFIASFPAVMDAVIGETRLVKSAEEKGQLVIRGRQMTIHQAAEQFKIYTGAELPKEFLKEFI